MHKLGASGAHHAHSHTMDELLHYCGLAVLSGAALYVVLGTFNFVYTYFLSPAKDLRKYGQWAGMVEHHDCNSSGWWSLRIYCMLH